MLVSTTVPQQANVNSQSANPGTPALARHCKVRTVWTARMMDGIVGLNDVVIHAKIDTEALARPEVRAIDGIIDDRFPPMQAPFFPSGKILVVARAENAADVLDQLFGTDVARFASGRDRQIVNVCEPQKCGSDTGNHGKLAQPSAKNRAEGQHENDNEHCTAIQAGGNAHAGNQKSAP